MIIVIEGPPKSGKTTLAEALTKRIKKSKVLRYNIGTSTGNNTSYLDTFTYNEHIDNYDPDVDNFVFDEYSWVHLAYSQVFGVREINSAIRWFVEAKLRTLGALFVYIPSAPDIVSYRLSASNPFCLPPERIRDSVHDIVNAYLRVHSESVVPCALYPRDTMDDIVTTAQRLQTHAQTVAQWPGYIGHVAPSALVVDADVKSGFGPCSPYHGSGTRYLLSCLDPITRDNYGYVNIALMTESSIKELHTRLGAPPIVALGQDVSKVLHQAGLEHCGVPHPTYIRRVHQARADVTGEYGELLSSILQQPGDYLGWRPRGTR